MLIPHSNPAVDEQFIFTGGNAARVLSGGYATREFDTWAITSGPQVLSNFNGIDGPLNPQVIGPGSGVTLAQKQKGQIPAWTDNTDRTQQYEYDSDGNRTKITYTEDNTFEAFSYNSFAQVTRHRTRDGNVTLYTYDSQGNQLT
jgi:YD repeat-containing protein